MLFFFFKQKTAYELRISDWSSDVCSSDLLTPLYAVRLGLQVDDVARLMAATIVGGAVLQWPIGRLSDRGDRRTVMAVLGVAAAALAGTLALVGDVQGAAGPQWRL